MIGTIRRAIFLGILLGATSGPLGAGESERIALRVSPVVSFAPANLVVRASIQADPDNRAVVIVAESPDFYRSSDIQLDGDRAPRTSRLEFRSLPPGAYQVTATLRGPDGHERARARQQINVIPSGGH